MSKEKEIEVYVQRLAGTYLKDLISIFACNVDSVNEPERTCDCTPIGSEANTALPGVLLSAENNNGFLCLPVVGSTVIVAISTRNTAFILMYSDIEKVQFMDGSLGGMVKVIDLVERLNNIEDKVNDIITEYNAHTHLAVDSVTSAPVTVSPTVSQVVGALTPTVRSDVENDLITQGVNPP